MSNERLDVPGVLAKFGVPPERIVDYLTLIGDTVDNVPGVEKVGPKTAAKWIAEHGSLDGVIAAAATIKGVAGENLRKALDWLPTGKRLVTVVTDCDLAAQVPGFPSLDALALQPVDREGLLDFYGRYGFKTSEEGSRSVAMGAPAAAALGGEGDDPPAAAPAPAAHCIDKHYETVLTHEALHAWLARIRQAPLTALDTETDSLDGDARAHRRHLAVGDGRRGGLHPAGAQLRRRAGAVADRRGAGRAEALARGREGAQARPEHQVRHACVRERRHRGARLCARHHARELCARGAQAARPGEPGAAPPQPQRPVVRRRVRQGRAPDPVRAGRGRARGALLGRGQRDDAARAPGAVAAAARAGRAAVRLRADRDAQRGGARPHRAPRRADRRGRAGAAEPRTGRTR